MAPSKPYRATCRVCAAPLNRDTGCALEPNDCPSCGHDTPVEPPAVPAPAAMPEGSRWKRCAAGFDDGRVLLVAVPGGLCIAAKSGKPHLHMTEMSLEELRALLATQGLEIVTEAEARVLEACAHDGGDTTWWDIWADRVWTAELARRAQQKDPRGSR